MLFKRFRFMPKHRNVNERRIVFLNKTTKEPEILFEDIHVVADKYKISGGKVRHHIYTQIAFLNYILTWANDWEEKNDEWLPLHRINLV